MFLAMLRSESAANPALQADALRGLRRYQQAPRPAPPPPMAVMARSGRASLRDYGGAGPPVVVVPSLINPPTVLDLAEDRSLLRWLATRGMRPLLVDWGIATSAERALTVAGHVETMLLPLIDAVGAPAALVGYCLGGTMAMAAAALRPVRGLGLIASPWRFGDYPSETLAALDEFWTQAAPSSEALGVLPMEVLQTAFWRLDPRRTIEKYARLASHEDGDAAVTDFVRLEDWANDGPPLTHAAARELFDDLFGIDLAGRGRWIIGGGPVMPEAIAAPLLQIVSTTDRIVPAASAAAQGERIELALGHVGMMVGGRARAALWEPLAAWLSRLP